jgi:hypothetical protein
MHAPEPRTVFMSIALVGIGSLTGAFLDRLSFPRVSRLLNVCASSKQFMVEFRTDEHHAYGTMIPGVSGNPLNAYETTLEVDGTRIGELALYGSLRHFFCEGNHRARIRYAGPHDEKLEHVVDFAVSRASLFHITQDWMPDNAARIVRFRSTLRDKGRTGAFAL